MPRSQCVSIVFRIKICGITRVDDAQLAINAGADAIGLNFYEGSPRFVSHTAAQEIAAAAGGPVRKVGVFVNAPADVICETFDSLSLDLVQLHGDESPEIISQLGQRPVIRAFRLDAEGLPPILSYLEECRVLDAMPRMVLLDAHQAGQYGGTGQTADWEAARAYGECPELPPLVLAGGLRADNVSQAIGMVRPAAVDVASGVESAPRKKERQQVEAFVVEARRAFRQTH